MYNHPHPMSSKTQELKRKSMKSSRGPTEKPHGKSEKGSTDEENSIHNRNWSRVSNIVAIDVVVLIAVAGSTLGVDEKTELNVTVLFTH